MYKWDLIFRNPTSTQTEIQWVQFKENERYCMIIDKELKCLLNVDGTNMKFWENIYNEETLHSNIID